MVSKIYLDGSEVDSVDDIFKDIFSDNAQKPKIQTCKVCKEEVNWTNTATDAGKDEWYISKMCEKCFDNCCYNLEENLELLNEDVLALVGNGVVLAGGALRTLVDCSEEIQDYDLFFLDQSKIEATKKYLVSKGYKNIFTCPKGELFTYYNEPGDIKVQLINKRNYLDCNDLINSFDITACCCAYDGNTFYKHDRFVFYVLNKRLNINVVEYPVASMKRIAKYINKGYVLTNEAAEKFVMLSNQMKLTEDNLAFYID